MAITKLNVAITKLTDEEYVRASEEWGATFVNQHEAYAVLLEEVGELDEEMQLLRHWMVGYWSDVRRGASVIHTLRLIRGTAFNAACEAVQVAAMAHKALETLRIHKEEIIR